MFKSVSFKNFMGQSASYNLEPHNIISGRNQGGKTTISKALMIACYGFCYGDEIDKKPDKIFRAYCGDTDDEAKMEITVDTDKGTLTRVYQKDAKGKVSQTITMNGERLAVNTNISELLDLRAFHPQEFWKLPSSKRLSILCGLFKIDPEKIIKLDSDINSDTEVLNRTIMEQRKDKATVENLRKKLQDMSESEGVNLTESEGRIKTLRGERSILLEKVADQEIKGSTKEKNTTKIQSLMEESTEIQNTIIDIPDADTSKLEDMRHEHKRMTDALQAKAKIATIEKAIADIDTKPPTPPAVNSGDVEDLQRQITAFQFPNEPTCCDRAIYEFVKDCIKLKDTMFSPDEERKDVINLLKRAGGPYKEKCNAYDKADNTEYDKLCQSKFNKMQMLRKYEEDKLAYRKRLDDIERFKSNLETERMAISEFELDESTQDRADELFKQITLVESSGKAAQANKDIQKRNEKRQATIASEISKLSEENTILESTADELLLSKIESLNRSIADIEAIIKPKYEYQAQQKIVDDFLAQVKKNEGTIAEMKDSLAQLKAQKMDLLNQVKDSISERANLLFQPNSIAVEVVKKDIIFYMVKPDGQKVMREVLCGAEQIEYDAALAYALVGDNGVVLSEVAELDKDRADAFIDKTILAKGCQMIVIGHSLDRFMQHDTNFVNVDVK